uniref:BTB domain-containing protein n=1 Tax=Panagrellus redivivus TaxID=6233 RepID=A0A7E4V927_PANRE
MPNMTFEGQLFDFVNPAWKDTVDVILVAGGNTIATNSDLLSSVSLEFKQDLNRPTNFMKPVFIEIEGFSTKTVKTAIEFCYSKRYEVPKFNLETALEMLLLGKKYNMKVFSEFLAYEVVYNMITERNFLIFSYRALEINSHPLDNELIRFYRDNEEYYPENDAIAKITQRLYVAGVEYGKSLSFPSCLKSERMPQAIETLYTFHDPSSGRR